MPLKTFSLLRKENNFYLLLGILGIRFIVLALYILYGSLNLAPDEAQYWTWSRELSWGYYSKPPGIAWQIFLTRLLFGETEWGIRASALIIGTLAPLALYRLVKVVYGDVKLAFYSALAFSLTPLSVMGSVLAITDGGMILFWILALTAFLESNLFLFGLFLGVGALFKWPIYILPVVLILFSPKKIGWILKGVLISLFGFLPALIWNIQHDFVTFRHVGTALQGGHYSNQGNPLEFLGAQAALLSPLFFIFTLFSFFKNNKNSHENVLKANTAIFLVPWVFSFFIKMQGNWADFILPTAMILGVKWILSQTRGKIWYFFGCFVSIFLVVGLGLNVLPFKSNPLKNALGHGQLKDVLIENGYNPKTDYLVADTYQLTSLLSFYGPNQDRAYFLNVGHRRLNQFSFWPTLAMDQRKGGFFVFEVDKKKMRANEAEIEEKRISPYFKKVEFLGQFPLYFQNGEAEKFALIYHVEGFTKEIPGHGNLY